MQDLESYRTNIRLGDSCPASLVVPVFNAVMLASEDCKRQYLFGEPWEDLRGEPTKVKRLTDCAQQCYDEPSCAYWSVDGVFQMLVRSADGTCVLKNSRMLGNARGGADGDDCKGWSKEALKCDGAPVCIAENDDSVGATRICTFGTDFCTLSVPTTTTTTTTTPTPTTTTTTPTTTTTTTTTAAAPTITTAAPTTVTTSPILPAETTTTPASSTIFPTAPPTAPPTTPRTAPPPRATAEETTLASAASGGLSPAGKIGAASAGGLTALAALAVVLAKRRGGPVAPNHLLFEDDESGEWYEAERGDGDRVADP